MSPEKRAMFLEAIALLQQAHGLLLEARKRRELQSLR